MTEEQHAPSPFETTSNPTELDKQDNEEYKAALEMAKEEMNTPYERQLTEEDLPPDLDKIQKGGIGTAMELDKRDQIDDFLDGKEVSKQALERISFWHNRSHHKRTPALTPNFDK